MVEGQVARVVEVAKTLLGANRYPSEGELADRVAKAITALGDQLVPSEHDQVAIRALRVLRSQVNVWVDDPSVLEGDDDDHEPWLKEARTRIEWDRWNMYREWILRDLPGSSVDAIDDVTEEVLSLVENPVRKGRWDRRGMVAGEVQSGKTANYTGLICKAADAGYKLIIVLAGLHNSLRAQTQERVDQGFIGLESEALRVGDGKAGRTGVGTLLGWKQGRAMTLTGSSDAGDFSLANASQGAGMLGGPPVVLVVKKNQAILRNLIAWVKNQSLEEHPGSTAPSVPDLPLLVIDDEADHASVNTKDVEYEIDEDGRLRSETDPSVINGLVRDLLNVFQKSAYVGYTATPFANIFIAEDQEESEHGKDLFPRDFIIRMKAPSNHIGPARVFGVAADEEAETRGLPIRRTVSDADDWISPGHKKEAVPGPMPESLVQAIDAFLLSCAARRARGNARAHNSMLVHVTRFVAVQAHVADQIEKRLTEIKNRLRYGDDPGPKNATSRLETLWAEDFVPTMQEFPEDLAEDPVSWDEVAAELKTAVASVRVHRINGTSADALAYRDHQDGLSVIAVGGDKLSRGLTLEGLSVSYYLRASRMYDTLMQMGRWFGYRPGYADLCRLYTTGELMRWYRGITTANLELFERFDQMVQRNSNPRDFALYVRESPEGLLVTAPAKMRGGTSMQLSFSDNTIETIKFLTDPEVRKRNLRAVTSLLDELDEPTPQHPGNFIWSGVGAARVASMLHRFETVEEVHKAHAELMALYIERKAREGELTDWSILLVSNSQIPMSEQVEIGPARIGLTHRAPDPDASPGDGIYQIKRVGSPVDELADLSPEKKQQAKEMTIERMQAEGKLDAAAKRKFASSEEIRLVRPASRGLLVLYPLDPRPLESPDETPIVSLLLSFPRSQSQTTISYKVPDRYTRDQFSQEVAT